MKIAENKACETWGIWGAYGILILFLASVVQSAPTSQPSTALSLDAPYSFGPTMASDEFDNGLSNWSVELEKGGAGSAQRVGRWRSTCPAGCTVWFKQQITGPAADRIRGHRSLQAGGENDRVSDLNCFWMARDSRSPDDLFATHRSGKFADYNPLKCYYVGLGGNSNTTTRFRRYIGDAHVAAASARGRSS